MRRRTILALLVLLVGAFAFAAVGCGGDDDDGGAGDTSAGETSGGARPDLPPVTALPSASCTDIEYEGEGEPDVLIASDLPLQGSSRTQTLQIIGAIKQVLEPADWKAGDVNVGFQSCDDSTAQAGKWDPGKCSQNANAYAENQSLLRHHRHVQLGLRRDHHPGAQPGAGRRPRDGLAGEHVRLPDRGRTGVRGRRAGQVLPGRHAQLRPRRRPRRLPGRGSGRVHAGAGHDEAVHPQRQGGVRPRRRDEHAQRGRAPRHRGRRLRGVGSEGVELRGAHEQDQAVRGGRRLPRRPDRRERRPGDQGQGQGPGPERGREALHA